MHVLYAGQWYLLFTCESCKNRQVVFPDLSNGKAKLQATYSVACPNCGHHGKYDGESLERYQHPIDAQSSYIPQ